ncbi:MAG TPA: hypothetical protein VMT89_02950 [Candidatus Acidoferrales bacterium]|nr:hypothetical protein [Candidatus Acidoferrales bacterium]
MSAVIDGPGEYRDRHGFTVEIAGRTKDGFWWWSLAGDWYDDSGRAVCYWPADGTHYVSVDEGFADIVHKVKAMRFVTGWGLQPMKTQQGDEGA